MSVTYIIIGVGIVGVVFVWLFSLLPLLFIMQSKPMVKSTFKDLIDRLIIM